jgi:hypothetical protein
MRTPKTCQLPTGLKAAQRQFERWRKSHQGRRRIPESLWAVAVKAARQFGINRTADTLRVDYYRLKKRVVIPGASNHDDLADQHAPPTFLELTPTTAPIRGQCIVEREDRAGSKMRIQLEFVMWLAFRDVLCYLARHERHLEASRPRSDGPGCDPGPATDRRTSEAQSPRAIQRTL